MLSKASVAKAPWRGFWRGSPRVQSSFASTNVSMAPFSGSIPNPIVTWSGNVYEERARNSVIACSTGSLYEVLGVEENATAKEIKAAYRKKAIKLHPDVNKAPNAKEQFMECKTAYDTLIDESSRAQYDRARKGGFGSGLGGDFGADWDSFGQYARDAAKSTAYSYNDLMADLDRELEAWQQERLKRKGRRADNVSDVLGDIAEEFLEFLESGADIPPKYQPGNSDRSTRAGGATESSTSGQSSRKSASPSEDGPSGSSSYSRGTQTDRQGGAWEYDEYEAYEDPVRRAERAAAEAAARSARIREIEAERKRKEAARAGEIEDELSALKRKLGL